MTAGTLNVFSVTNPYYTHWKYEFRNLDKGEDIFKNNTTSSIKVFVSAGIPDSIRGNVGGIFMLPDLHAAIYLD
jgi:hypothetical protein